MSLPNRRPIAFIVAATNHGSMLVNRHDYRLVEGGGYGVGFQLLNTSAFDPEEVDFALQLLRGRRRHFGDGVVAIDCGANVGVHTIEWAKEMFGWGSVTAFEAQERIFYALAGNITLNNCFNARAVWAAIGRQRGSIFVPTPDYFVPSSFGSLEIQQRANTEFIGQPIDYAGDDMQVTPMTAIDDLLLDRLDFIKIDIEGMEMDALMGAEASIARFKPQLLIEKIKSDESAILAFVGRHGYKVFAAGINLLAVHGDDPAANQVSTA
jgi:FkbM family methyltransferase